MNDFARTTEPVAKKQHRCEWCWWPIVVGEKYYRFVGKWGGDFQDWAMHTDCRKACTGDEICPVRHVRGEGCAH